MTADELQRIVNRLANQCWVRYWLNYSDRHDNILMAIQCLDNTSNVRFQPVEVRDIKDYGFTLTMPYKIYTIPRTNPDGTPYVSKLL